MKEATCGKCPKFPIIVEKNGRIGRITFWKKTGVYGTYFRFGGKPRRSSFSTLEGARTHLESEFVKLDTNQVNSLTLYPTRHELRVYHELEERLRERSAKATLHDAVEYYLMNHEHQQLKPRSVKECVDEFVAAQEARNLSPGHIKSLKKHFRRFLVQFKGDIHGICADPLLRWLNTTYPGAKTRKNVRGDLVTLFKYAQDILSAIPPGKTAPEKIAPPVTDKKNEEDVEIYLVGEFERLLLGAIEHDIALLPAMAIGGFAGLRPAEIHGEEARYEPIQWDAFKWDTSIPTPTRKEGFDTEGTLDVKNQKVRNIKTRHLPIYPALAKWMEPFKGLEGRIWRLGDSYNHRLRRLVAKLNKEAADTEKPLHVVFDGFRHSQASYRIRHLNNDLNLLAGEMGNSPEEIVHHYRKDVSDQEADRWFSLMPPPGYKARIAAALRLRLS